MNHWIHLEQIGQYFTAGSVGYKVLMAIIILIAYQVLKKIANRAILNLAKSKGVNKARLSFIQRCFNVTFLFLFASLFAIVAGIGYGDVSLFLS
ncbi:mechanosensitive ion channel family protein, partial [Vibrio astriarenae]